MKHYLLTFIILFLFMLNSYSVFSQAEETKLPYPSEEEIQTKMLREELLFSKSDSILESVLKGLKSVTGPEQDCGGAIQVCNLTYTQTNSYGGHGAIQEVYGNCLNSNETNSVWYVFTAQNNGSFAFMINTPNDYDFALYDITSIGCAGISSATPIRCNYSADYGSTGLTLPSSGTTNLSNSASGSPLMPGINANAGSTYVLIVDNYTGNENGYTITFSGTASIYDNTDPTLSSVTDACGSDYVIVELSELIQCSSIHASDFALTDPSSNPVTISSVVGDGCSAYNSLVNSIKVYYTGVTVSGSYTLTINTGSDGNTLLDKCGNELATGVFDAFLHLEDVSISATFTDICAGGSSVMTTDAGFPAPPGAATYSWVPSGASTYQITVSPTITTAYTVNVTYGSCTLSDNQTIAVVSAPVVSVTPEFYSQCTGVISEDLTATATIDGSPCTDCDYSWNSGTYTENGVASSTWTNRPVGVYTVTSTSASGCPGSNTATSTLNDGSLSTSSTCNVVYVTHTGGCTTGTTCGVDPTNPATLDVAIAHTACSDFVIKMQTGTYNISNYIEINSFITIEGGYNSTFTTKTSNMASGSATTIVRNATPDDNSGIAVSAIKVVAGARYFRLQDLRIELPSNHTISSKKTNYGVYLGTGCHDYDIVRCCIDAGQGADGLDGLNGANVGNGSDGSDGNWDSGGAGGSTGGGAGGDGSYSTCGDNGIAGASGGGAGGSYGCWWSNGSNGGNGTAGTIGTNGGNGAAATFAGNYFVPGGDGVTGTAGTAGKGGGGGGGGGSDLAGTAGTSAGGCFGVFSVSKGVNSNIIDCEISSLAGVGGTGGFGTAGGAGGAGGDGDCNGWDAGCGGDGGNGGAGGFGGSSGYGASGIAYDVCDLVGTTGSNIAYDSKTLTSQPVVTIDNISCTEQTMNHVAGISALWQFNDGGSNDGTNSGVGSTRPTTYPTTGRKSFAYDGQVYYEFNNIITSSSPGTIISPSTGVCSGISVNFESSHAGELGYTYVWTVNAGGNPYVIDDNTAESTDITFTNATGTTYSATVTLTVSSRCCGALIPIDYIIDVYPEVGATTASADDYTVCSGGDVTLTATAPSGVNFAWYTVASGGSPFASGITASVTGLVAGTYAYYVEAVSSDGCVGPRLDMTDVVVTDVAAPTGTSIVTCSPGNIVIEADPVADAIAYNWYSGSCGGTLEQSSPSLSYTATITVPATETYYVAVELDGCDESDCTTLTAELLAESATATWTGAINSDWFNVGNWAGASCLPTCGTNVTIPNTANSPVIGENLEAAQCEDITIQNGSVLSFQLKGELEVCGDFYHYGTLTMNDAGTDVGTIIIIGGTSQSYIKTTGTGYINNLTIGDGTAATTFILTANIDINANLNILPSSEFSPGIYIINLEGNWINYGTFNYATSTVIFDGTSQQDMNIDINRVEYFYNVTIDGSDVRFYYNESGIRKINVTNDLIINPGKKLSTVKQ